MRQEHASKNRILFLLIAVLFAGSAFAGCFGDDAPDPEEDTNTATGGDGGEGKKKDTQQRFDDMSGGLNDPAAHYHHYWGDRESVIIYSGGVPFNNYHTQYYPTTLAWAQFGTEDDGNGWDDGNDISPDDGEESGAVTEDGIAETVFAGTDKLVVHFPDGAKWPPGVRMMWFQWKPANTPIFQPESGPVAVEPGQQVTIPLTRTGESDPPHQYSTSRWQFLLLAANEICPAVGIPGEVCPPAFIQDPEVDMEQGSKFYWGSRSGGDGLTIYAHTNGEKNLDPPHPNFWADGDVRDLGEASGDVDLSVQTPLVRERIHAMNDIAMPANNIVPLGTEKVEVRLRWQNTAPQGEDVSLTLYYHGADTAQYQRAPDPRKEGEWYVYEIYDSEGTQVDPPYESHSFWRFKLVPTFENDQIKQENMGQFEGSYTMKFSAHKEEGFVLT